MTLEEAQERLDFDRDARAGMGAVRRRPRPPLSPADEARLERMARDNEEQGRGEAEIHREQMAEARAVVAAAAKRSATTRPATRARKRAPARRTTRKARGKPTDDDGPRAREVRA